MRYGGEVRIDGVFPATAGFTGAESAMATTVGFVSKIMGSLGPGWCYCAIVASIASAARGGSRAAIDSMARHGLPRTLR